MRSRVSAQSHLEYRPSGFHWRRRWPCRVLRVCTPSKKISLLFSLRSHVLPDAKALAQKLTLLSDIAFAGVTERTMAIAPDILERLLVELCRFLIEVADAERELAPMRTPEVAAFDLACATAAVETLRHTIATRDREAARNPLRQVAARLGIALDESDPDWQRLAFRALRVMLDAEQENLRRDHGVFEGPSAALQTVRPLIDGAASAYAPPVTPPTVFVPVAPCQTPTVAPSKGHTVTNAAVFTQPSAPAQDENVQQPHVGMETAPMAEPSPEPTRASTSCPTIEKGSEDYIEARSRGHKTFKATEQTNEKA